MAQPAGDPRELLAQLRESVSTARSMPLSASCVVNRAETVALIDRLGAALPDSLAAADALVAQGDGVVAAAREQAAAVLAGADVEAERRLADSATGAAAQAWAQTARAQAEADAAAERARTEEFVDAKLAHLEAVLVRTVALASPDSPHAGALGDVRARLTELAAEIDQMLAVVRRGRERMAGREHMEDLGEHVRALDADPDAPGAGLGTREELR